MDPDSNTELHNEFLVTSTMPQDNLHVKQSPNNWTKILDRLYLKEGSIEFKKAPEGRLFIKRHLKKAIF